MKTFFNFKYTASVLILKIFRANQIRFEQISNGGKTGRIHVIFNHFDYNQKKIHCTFAQHIFILASFAPSSFLESNNFDIGGVVPSRNLNNDS